jgi:hypothetical protein
LVSVVAFVPSAVCPGCPVLSSVVRPGFGGSCFWLSLVGWRTPVLSPRYTVVRVVPGKKKKKKGRARAAACAIGRPHVGGEVGKGWVLRVQLTLQSLGACALLLRALLLSAFAVRVPGYFRNLGGGGCLGARGVFPGLWARGCFSRARAALFFS